MYQQLYTFDPHLTLSHPDPNQDNLGRDSAFKIVEPPRSNSTSAQHAMQPSSLNLVQGSSGSLSGTLPTFTFIPHQHPATNQANPQLPLNVQSALKPSQDDNQQRQQQQQFHTTSFTTLKYENSSQGPESSTSFTHHFGNFPSMESVLPGFYGMYQPVDIVHSPVLAVPDLPTTLPPLHSGNSSNTFPITLPQTREFQQTNATQTQPSQPPNKKQKKASRERAPWTPEEDNLLRLAVQLYGDKTEKWAKIAACVPGRTNKNCRKRWFHSLDPSLRKGAWTDEEDQLLREGVMKYPNQWSKIADMLEGRTDDQCAKRWRESLDPSIDRSEWTPEEDRRLMEKYEEFGSQWQKIAQFFDGRPGLHCRNRWRKLQRMMQIKKDKEAAAAAAAASASSTSTTTFIHGLPDGQQQQQQKVISTSYGPNSDTCSLASSSTSSSPLGAPFQALLTQQHGSEISPLESATNNTLAAQNDQNDVFSNLKPYGCDIPGCYMSFPQSCGLFYHMKIAHPDLENYDKPYRCAMPNCVKRYKNINGLQYHLREAKGSSCHGPLQARNRIINNNHNTQSGSQQLQR